MDASSWMDASHWNFFLTQKHDTVYIRKTTKSSTQRFSSKILWKLLIKSDTKICKIQKSVRNIPRNNVIKDNITLFLKTVNKVINICICKKVKNGYYSWWFISWFVKLLRVTNCDHKKWKFLFLKLKATSATKQ